MSRGIREFNKREVQRMDFGYVIFDMDGTLLDSIPYWERLALGYLEELGVSGPSDLDRRLSMMSVQEAGVCLREEFLMEKTAEEICSELCERIHKNYREDILLKPGVAEWLAHLKGQGAHMCVATASSAEIGKAALDRNGILPNFDFLIDCEMVGIGKIDPAVYHLAAQRFGVTPADCVVVEDAAFALKTAKAAGYFTIGVYESSEPAQDLIQQYSDLYIKDFRELL